MGSSIVAGQDTAEDELPVVIDADLVITGLKAKDRVEVITVLSDILLAHGYVTEDFCEAVLAREESFPTGLPLPDIPVAIPHAEAAYCRVPAIAVATLDEPVDFREMGGDPDSVLAVQIVFLLALNDPKKQVDWLQRLVLLFQKPGLLGELKGQPDAPRLASYLQRHFLQEGNHGEQP